MGSNVINGNAIRDPKCEGGLAVVCGDANGPGVNA
jgi:hypothetical protein